MLHSPFPILRLVLGLGLTMNAASRSLLTAEDPVLPAPHAPGELTRVETPQFLLFGFDDNPEVEPMEWILEVGRAHDVPFAFYSNGKYFHDNEALQAVHRRALAEDHEIGNHTENHRHGGAFTEAEWREEIEACASTFAAAGIPREAVAGFRTPFLEYNAATFAALDALDFLYDTTIEEGYQEGKDGTNFLWPYTLDQGSPGNAATTEAVSDKRIGVHPGLWIVPIHVFMVPDDATCPRYDLEPGLRERMRTYIRETGGWDWPAEEGKISGLDWNVLEMAGATPAEFLGILKYNLDLRLAGNRAPMMVGAHTALFPAGLPARRAAIEDFLDYALSKPEVRVVTPTQLISWMRKPVALDAP